MRWKQDTGPLKRQGGSKSFADFEVVKGADLEAPIAIPIDDRVVDVVTPRSTRTEIARLRRLKATIIQVTDPRSDRSDASWPITSWY